MMISIRLPYPPSLNRYWKKYRNRMVVSSEGYSYRGEVHWACKAAGIHQIDGSVAIYANLHPKARKKESAAQVRCIDLDNAIKVALDSLNGVAYKDDRQIDLIVIRRCEPVDGGALVLSVGPMT